MVLRHQKAALYHPFVDALALTLVDIPISAINVSVLSIILYFLAGLQRTAVGYKILCPPSHQNWPGPIHSRNSCKECYSDRVISLTHYSSFSIFLLFLFSITVTMKAWLRAITAACKSEAAAQTFAGISLLVLTTYTGMCFFQTLNYAYTNCLTFFAHRLFHS